MKRQKIQIHQIFVIVAFIALLILTVYLALKRTNLLSEAGTTEDPKFINVVNENTEGFTITWITTKNTQGAIVLPEENFTFSENGEIGKTHLVKLTGLQPGKRYEFQIQSGTTLYDNLDSNYEAFTTKQVFTTENKLLFGRIFGQDNVKPLTEGYVTIHAESEGIISNRIYSQLNNQGGWQLDYSKLLSKSLTQKFDVSQKSLVTLSIYSPEITDPVTRTYDIKLNETLQLNDIFLGEDVPWELPAIEDESLTIESE